ncbi:unnamed protein product [Oppiella nova]|uniref:Sushi domain-containing protein n=1 Tax=Oppiella nova TaxID=334625 RepID=A0A7R9LSA4_9ACAR|nr:unnamed protein product [Oppiella nova]CAG2165873.1 unnamed protein product [Oppiella nova]
MAVLIVLNGQSLWVVLVVQYELDKVVSSHVKKAFKSQVKQKNDGKCESVWDSEALPSCGESTSMSRCSPNLIAPINGYISGNCENPQLDQECSIGCDTDFQLSPNTRQIRCTQDGWDTLEIPEINYASNGFDSTLSESTEQCDDIQPPQRGFTETDCVNPQQDFQCKFTCKTGCTLTEPSVVTCQSNGWDPQIPDPDSICTAPVCPPIEISNGNSCDETPVGGECRLSCDNGQQIDPSIVRCVFIETETRCESKWEPKPLPTCESRAKKCRPDIRSPANGYTEGNCENANLDDECIIKCDKGFKLSPNSPRIRCTENGWDPEELPSCRPNKCSNLVETKNLIFEDNSHCKPGIPGMRCEFRCAQGYSLSPDIKSLMCSNDNEWSNEGQLPQCIQQTSCSSLTPPAHGDFESPDPCRQPKPESQCTVNGVIEWLSVNLNLYLAPLNDIDFGVKTGVCAPGVSGKKCKFECKNNYHLVGESIYTCKEDGQWDRKCCPSCVAQTKCPSVQNIENAEISGKCKEAAPGDICTVKCSNDKIHRMDCLKEGKWSIPIPNCPIIPKASCKSLHPPLNGYLEGKCSDKTQESQTGYTLVGKSELKCTSNGWSSEVPKCKAVECPAVNRPQPNGAFSGFKLSPNTPNVVCNSNGKWSDPNIASTTISCVANNVPTGVCPHIAKPRYGEITGSCNPAQTDKTCSMKCNKGFQLLGNQTIICGRDGHWSGHIPRCLRECPRINTFNGRAIGWCAPGLEGHICRLKHKQSVNQCPNIGNPENGLASGGCANGGTDSVCSFTCSQGFQLEGLSQVTCDSNGVWSGKPPVCERIQCPSLTPSAGISMTGSCTPGLFQMACALSCQTDSSKSMSVTCQADGTWSETIDNFECTATSGQTCPALVLPVGAKPNINCSFGAIGSKCDIKCKYGYQMVGRSSMTCDSSGKWTGRLAQCLRSSGPQGCPLYCLWGLGAISSSMFT